LITIVENRTKEIRLKKKNQKTKNNKGHNRKKIKKGKNNESEDIDEFQNKINYPI
jgi:hypothetical protein